MFNNNNYLPDLNHYPPAGPQLPSVSASLQQAEPVPVAAGTSSYARSGNFRFLSPTQVTAVPAWVPPATSVGIATAPGMGASWQHSVPSTLPWANRVVPRFTAQNSLSQSLPVYTMPMTVNPQTTMMQVTPKPSIRSLRLKRRFHSSVPDELDGPSSKRYLSEKMAHWFKQLQISPMEDQTKDTPPGSDIILGANKLDNGWQRFQEVEKRLEVDLEEEELDEVLRATMRGGDSPGMESSRLQENGTVLTIPLEVKREVENPNPVIPSHIMKTITNPCMDVVLWKSPEALIAHSHHTAVCSNSVLSNTPSNQTSLDSQAAMATSLSRQQSSESSSSVGAESFDGLSQSSMGVTSMELMDSMDVDMDL